MRQVRRRRRTIVITHIFTCGSMVASQSCDSQGDKTRTNLDPNVSDGGPNANPIAAVYTISQVEPYFPITEIPTPELARCTAAQMQDGTTRGCFYPIDGSVAHASYTAADTTCCPPLSSQRDELARCNTGGFRSNSVVGTLSRGCVFPAPGVARLKPEADPKEVCCPEGLSLIDEHSRCGPTLGAAEVKGCWFPVTGTPLTGSAVNVCCPVGASLADGAAAAAMAGAESAGLTGERLTCTSQDVLNLQFPLAGDSILAGCFEPKNASVPKVDPTKGITNFCCPPGDSTVTVDQPDNILP